MRVLVSWGSKLGGTEGIARTIADELQRRGVDVVAQPAAAVRDIGGYDAAIIGGALYANRWQRDAYRLAARNVAALRRIPVWLFSSGPLDDSADRADIPPATQVAVLMERIGALGHTTFGGRLLADATGFPASAMAKKRSGDWRNQRRIQTWAADIAAALPEARPGPAVDPPARSLGRLVAHGVAGWAVCAVLMAGLMQVAGIGPAIAIHAVAAPLIFVGIAVHYFRARGARDPFPTALAFTTIVVLLDGGIVAGLVLRSLDMFTSVWGTWLPFALIFLATWTTGMMQSMMPATKPLREAAPDARPSPPRSPQGVAQA
jgi:menaquinone-dependent protoporphyrinogen oxidase